MRNTNQARPDLVQPLIPHPLLQQHSPSSVEEHHANNDVFVTTTMVLFLSLFIDNFILQLILGKDFFVTKVWCTHIHSMT
jgi:hypothetical protein